MYYRSVPAHHKPYPELVEPQASTTPYWIIDSTGKPWLPTNGMTSLADRKLLVPLRWGAHSVAVHEIGHVRWSPEHLPRVLHDPRTLMAVEDARINLGLAVTGLPVTLTEDELAQVATLAREDLQGKDAYAFVLRAVAALGTNAGEAILAELAAFPEELRALAHHHVRRVHVRLLRARRVRGSPVADFAVVRRLARELARDLARDLAELGLPTGQSSLRLAAGCCLGHGRPGRALGHAHGTDEEDGEDHPSGEMRVVLAPLPHSCGQPRSGRRGRPRATSEGSLPRYHFRWPIDGAIFRRTIRQRGGTVLIDASGSMSLDAAGIDQILAASSGAALVAMYSGHDKQGELRIVARDGRRADAQDLVPSGRGNIVDEPALEWLARQKGPRVWISDGGVTGVGDTTSAALQRRCQEICSRSQIRRVKTIQEAAAFLSRGGRRAGVA